MSDLHGRISPMVIQSALSISKRDHCMQLYSRSDPKKEVGIILFSKGGGGGGRGLLFGFYSRCEFNEFEFSGEGGGAFLKNCA